MVIQLHRNNLPNEDLEEMQLQQLAKTKAENLFETEIKAQHYDELLEHSKDTTLYAELNTNR